MSSSTNTVCPFERTANVCKICEGTDGAMESLFCQETDGKLLNKIYKCTGVRLKPFCGMISPICEFCRDRIDQFDEDFKPHFNEYVVEKAQLDDAPEDDPFNCLDPCGDRKDVLELDDDAEIVSVTKVISIEVEYCNESDSRVTAQPTETEEEFCMAIEEQESGGENEGSPVLDQTESMATLEVDNPNADNDTDGVESIVSEPATAPKRQRQSGPKLPVECSVCGKKVQHLRDHVKKMHIEKRRYKCHYCDRTFPQICNLTYHVRTHTGEKPFPCNDCSKSFICLSHLRSHQRSHLNEKQFQCEVCSRRFNQQCNLTKHMRTHTGEKPYRCSICKKAFMNLSNKKIHEMRHRGERNYTCEICSKSFYDFHHLERHQQIHWKKQTFECAVCKQLLDTMEEVQSHRQAHMATFYGACDKCGKACSSFGIYYRHMKVVHSTGTQKNHTCVVCQKMFASKAKVDVHVRRVHDKAKPLKATNVMKIDTEAVKRQLERGLSKPYRCSVCNKLFRQADNLRLHLRIHSDDEKLFSASSCSRSLEKAKHANARKDTGTGEKGHKCEICGQRFARVGALKDHRLSHSEVGGKMDENVIVQQEPVKIESEVAVTNLLQSCPVAVVENASFVGSTVTMAPIQMDCVNLNSLPVIAIVTNGTEASQMLVKFEV